MESPNFYSFESATSFSTSPPPVISEPQISGPPATFQSTKAHYTFFFEVPQGTDVYMVTPTLHLANALCNKDKIRIVAANWDERNMGKSLDPYGPFEYRPHPLMLLPYLVSRGWEIEFTKGDIKSDLKSFAATFDKTQNQLILRVSREY